MSVPEIPGFRIERQLGAGAYGRVYLAHEVEGLARPVALKVFAAEGHEAYTRELEALKRVEELRRQGRHVEIVQALGSGEHEGRGWIALEYLEDGSLKDAVDAKGPLPWEEALDAVRQATAAVKVLHDAGIFHRDVKPANLLVGADGGVRLGDFGLSRDLDASLSAAGSPAFAAPEVIAGQVADGQRARVDVYGLGATLAYLLCGEPARPGRPDAFALERRGTPRPLVDLVLEAMAYEPDERPADAGALGTALAGVREKIRTLPAGPEGASEEDESAMKNATKKAPFRPAPTPRTDLDVEVQRLRCPFCHDPISTDDRKQACVECMAWHHDACWSEHGRCAACQAEAVTPQAQAKVQAKVQTQAGKTPQKLVAVVAGALAAMMLLGLVSFKTKAKEVRLEALKTLKTAHRYEDGVQRLLAAAKTLRKFEGERLSGARQRMVSDAAARVLATRTLDQQQVSKLAAMVERGGPFSIDILGQSWVHLTSESEPELASSKDVRYQIAQALGSMRGVIGPNVRTELSASTKAKDWLRQIAKGDPAPKVRAFASTFLGSR